MRALQRLWHYALANTQFHLRLSRDVPEISLDVVRRFGFPDFQNVIDGFKEHRRAIRVQAAKGFGVGGQSTGGNSENKPTVQHVIQHCYLCGHRGRVRVGHVNGARSQFDLFCLGCNPSDKADTVRNVFRSVRDVFANVGFNKSQLIRQ